MALTPLSSTSILKILLLLVLTLSALPALAATLSLSPSTGVYTAGGTFTVSVVVNTAGEPINAAEGSLRFNPRELSVVGVSKGSIFNLWTADPSFSNSAGTISFGGGSPSGYTGNSGVVMNITFRALNAGSSKVTFSSGSVLAADGQGTNVLTGMGNGSYTISSAAVTPEPEVIEYVAPANTPSAPTVRSSSHPDPAGWYAVKSAQLSWNVPAGVTGVRTLLDGNSGSIPTKVYDSPINSITLPDLPEGVSYFHIQFRNEEGWGRVAHYRLAVDTEKPTRFDIKLPDGADLSNPTQTLVLDVEDATSLVRRFEVQIDGGEPFEHLIENGSSTITLPPLSPGKHSVIIEAFDAAGNGVVNTFSFQILSFDRPVFTDYPQQMSEEVIPVIKGLTRPGSKVTLTLHKLGAEPAEYELTADNEGVFTFIPEGTLQSGVYELYAVAIDTHGAQSEPSETIRIAVQQPGYIAIGSFIVSVLSVIVPLIALTLLMGALIVFTIYRVRRFRRKVAVEADEALKILAAEFKKLESTLNAEAAALQSSRKTKKLTAAESHLIDTMKSGLQSTKRSIEKEITDVEQLVDKSTKNESA